MNIKIFVLASALLLAACGEESKQSLGLNDFGGSQLASWISTSTSAAVESADDGSGVAAGMSTRAGEDDCYTTSYNPTNSFEGTATTIISCNNLGIEMNGQIISTWNTSSEPDVYTQVGSFTYVITGNGAETIIIEYNDFSNTVLRFADRTSVDLNFSLHFETPEYTATLQFETTDPLLLWDVDADPYGDIAPRSGSVRISDSSGNSLIISFVDGEAFVS